MDLTPPGDLKPQHSQSSTPVTHLYSSRKRKRDESLEYLGTPPKFSSTLNDSLITDLKDICLVGSVPNTPEKHRNVVTAVSSPIQESRKILYGSLKIVKPEREKRGGILSIRDLTSNKQDLLNQILNINVIMDVIFKYLSGGDLYRFSLVSESFCKALERNPSASLRYRVYKNSYNLNKENYMITPPGSPDKCDSPPRTSSDNLNKFLKIAKQLKRSQSLTKCRKCESASVVENDVSQCQNLSCGLIYCLLCSSSSETGASDFKDLCGHSVLRPKLGNISNQMESSTSPFFNFSNQDSGFYSENEITPRVKRNLFSTSFETPKSSKPLSMSNKSKIMLPIKKKDPISFVPVVPNQDHRKQFDCDSPPRYGYAVGSKQSKKNLKRLTR